MNRMLATLLLAAALVTPCIAAAQDDDELDAGRVIAVEPRPYRMVHEFSALAGIIPLDALYTGYSLGGSYTLHLSDLWAWEAINFHYSANVESGLRVTLAERWSVDTTKEPRFQYLATSHLIFAPLFGKLAFFNSSILYAETYLAVGGGISHFDDGFRPTLSFGPGVRLYFGQRVSVRFDARSALVPDLPGGIEHVLHFMVGVSFNFGSVRATETEIAQEREVVDPLDALDELYPQSKPERAKERKPR